MKTGGPKSMRLPVTPPKTIVMMEDHDKAYLAWKERGVRDRILVHVDAHVDFGWIPEIDFNELGSGKEDASCFSRRKLLLNPTLTSRKKMVNIGNYICPAMRDGMVKKFYWVIPDKSWKDVRGKKHILKQLKQILKIKKYGAGKPELYADHIRCRIFDRELIVCSLENLERIEEPVLLDIDVDFMLTQYIWDDLNPRRLPWIFPEELFKNISSRINDIDMLTIAYSVEGGFTPLRFKYLGDELRLFFENELSVDRRKIIQYKIKALDFEKEKRREDAVAAYERVLEVDDSDASAYFNLFLLTLEGPVAAFEKAKHFYDQALARDRSYATPYNNYGILYLLYNKPKRAQAEYEKFLDCNSNNAAVYNGLGHISLARRRYARAQEFFDQCLAVDKDHPEAKTGKAIVSYKLGRLKEAEDLLTGLTKDRPDDAEIYWWLGRIAQKRHEVCPAIDNYKRAVMHGGEGPFVHLILARLYLTRGFYFRAFEEIKRLLRA
jgi:tetratricopeptide (TPR) repeat protein